MKKLLLISIGLGIAGFAAYAGGLAEGLVDPEVLEPEDDGIGWLLPTLLLIGVAALVASNDDGT
ncbi:hypothetical protein [Nereida ignava]|uniref:Uncharacterized protein n=1 Tax=Nereida ignava TaxID=282199 RepID=A0A0U1NJ84_9RHOB|nr:hypothetical protein [Nereida ignava]CRK74806.1 hypothetical protein NIG5292_00844 [Nereida ignava]SFJ61894.1 hypothetical protein SAMN02745667_01799 [Nereida ignava DSM 16309]